MALDVATGLMTIPTSTGNQSVTGLSFQPKIVLFWGAQMITPQDTEFRDFSLCFGAAISSSKRFCVAASDDCDAATMNTARYHTEAACIRIINAVTNTLATAVADFVSMNSDGFTINWSTAPASSGYVSYLALGGSDLNDVDIVRFQAPSTATTQVISSLAFQPKLVCFATAMNTSAPPTRHDHALFNLGWADGTSQVCSSITAQDAVGTSVTNMAQRTDKVIHQLYINALSCSASCSSLNSNGFTLSWSNVAASITNLGYIYAICLGGNMQAKVQSGTVHTTTNSTKAFTGVGFTPKALWLQTWGNVASTAATTPAGYLAFSVATGATDFTRQRHELADNQGSSYSASFARNGSFSFLSLSTFAVFHGEYFLDSIDVDGFTLSTDLNPASVSRQLVYVSLGDGPTPISVVPGVAIATASASAPTASTSGADQSLTLGTAIATASAINPTATPGATTLVPQVATAAASGSAPTATGGAVTSTPASTQATATAIAPTATPGTVTGTPASTQATASATAPAVTAGTATATPTTAIATASASAPAITAGGVSLVPTTAIATGSVIAPDPVLASIVEPTTAFGTATAIAPDITVGEATAVPTTAAATASASAPDITVTVDTTPTTAVATATATDADTVGDDSAAPTVAVATAAAFAPSIIVGDVSQAPGTAAATATAIAPDITGAISQATGTAIASASATPPTVTTTVSIVPTTAAGVAVVNDVTVIAGEALQSPAATAATASAIDVTVTPGPVTAVPGVAEALTDASAPTVTAGATTATPDATTATATAIDILASGGDGQASPGAAEAIASAVDVATIAGDVSADPTLAAAMASVIDVDAFVSTATEPTVAEAFAIAIDPTVVPAETFPEPGVAIAQALAGDTTAIGMINLAPGVAIALAMTDDPEVFTCPEIELDPHGREGIGVVQPQSGTNYPFVSPSEDIRNLIADLYLEYDDPSDYTSVTPHELPLKIAYIYGLGCTLSEKPLWAPDATHYVDVIITDADDNIVFDSTQADYFADLEWGEYKIFEWRTDDGVLRIVAYVSWPDGDEPVIQQFPKHIAPENGILDARSIYRMPKRVRSLRLVLDTMTKTNINLVAGYNMQLVHDVVDSEPGERNVEQITINAQPGAGDGVFPGCIEQDIVLRRINGVGPNAPGDFLLAATDCYWVRQPTTIIDEAPLTVVPSLDLDPMSGHLQLGNDCGPCCTCDDYVDTIKYMYRLRDEGVRLGGIVSDSRDQYHENRERWNDAKECLEKRPLRLSLQAQNCPFLDVVAQYCNQTDKCLTDIVLIIRFSTLPEIEPSCACAEESDPVCDDPVPELPDDLNENVKVVCGYTFISGAGPTAKYTLDGKWCEYRAYFDAIDPFSSVSVKFRLEFPGNGVAIPEGGSEPTPVAVSACMRATVGGKWLCIPPDNPTSVAVDRQTAVLECPASDSPTC